MVRSLILGRKDMAHELCELLGKLGHRAIVAESREEIESTGRENRPYRLAIITDTFPDTIDLHLVDQVRQRCDPEYMICLLLDEDHDLERTLRSAGLIFFGSYRSFFALGEQIIKKLVVLRGEIAGEQLPDRGDAARGLEHRLLVHPPLGKSRMKRLAFSARIVASELLARFIELLAALLVLTVAGIPALAVLLLRRQVSGEPVFDAVDIRTSGGGCLKAKRFHRVWPILRDVPLFAWLLSGDIALVGTAITSPGDDGIPNPESGYINLVKPGIVSLWEIRKSSRIAHEGKTAIEWEYAFRKNLFYDFMLMLRTLPVLLYRQAEVSSASVFQILGLDLRNVSMEDGVSLIDRSLAGESQSTVFFVNPDCLNKMVSDEEYFSILSGADHVFPDGIGLVIAGKLLGMPLRENINGTDMLPYICRMAASRGYSIFLLGGKPGIAKQAATEISTRYGVVISGTAHGYFDHQIDSAPVVEAINASGADILLVAFGAPLQEKWIAKNRHALEPRILMGVGGLFDFYSGTINRAPVWVREIGFEWVYRILQEPGRMWKRYVIGNPLFLFRVLKWKLVANGS